MTKSELIAELAAANPHLLSRDVETIVATLRAQRHKFNLTEQAKQVEGKPRGRATSLPKPKPTPAALPAQISLSDLGLDD